TNPGTYRRTYTSRRSGKWPAKPLLTSPCRARRDRDQTPSRPTLARCQQHLDGNDDHRATPLSFVGRVRAAQPPGGLRWADRPDKAGTNLVGAPPRQGRARQPPIECISRSGLMNRAVLISWPSHLAATLARSARAISASGALSRRRGRT